MSEWKSLKESTPRPRTLIATVDSVGSPAEISISSSEFFKKALEIPDPEEELGLYVPLKRHTHYYELTPPIPEYIEKESE